MNGNMNLGKRVTALEKDGGADIKKEISDLQASVSEMQSSVTTVQEEISNLENKVNSGHVYSTEEKVVGKWIDGKPIYEKIMTGTFNGEKSTLYLGDVDVESIIGVVNLADGSAVAIGMNLNNVYYAAADYTKSTGNIEVYAKGWTLVGCVVTVQYTKTTDTATT